jgi:hypothetical protein
VAAVGGLLLGLGLGLSIGRRSGGNVASDRNATEARIRTVVLPVLERRADELGLKSSPPVDPKKDVIGAAVSLASAIQRSDIGRELGLSDTVEFESKGATKTVSHRPPAA